MVSLSCPKCESQVVKRNGYTRHGKQNLRCLDCGRQFSVEPDNEEALLFQECSGLYYSEEPLIL